MKKQIAKPATASQMSIMHMWGMSKGEGISPQKKGSTNLEPDAIPTGQPSASDGKTSASGQTDSNVINLDGQPDPACEMEATSCMQNNMRGSWQVEDDSKVAMSQKGKDKEAVLLTQDNPPKRLFSIFSKTILDDERALPVKAQDGTRQEPSRELKGPKASTSSSRTGPKPPRALRMKRTVSAPSTANSPIDVERTSNGPSSQAPRAGPSNSRGPREVIDIEMVEVIEGDLISKHSAPAFTVGSRDKPITIDSSPTKALKKETNPTSLRKEIQLSSAGLGKLPFHTARRSKVGEGEYARWPDGESQHVRGVQQNFQGACLDFVRSTADPSGEELPFSLQNFNLVSMKADQPPPSPSQRITRASRTEANIQLIGIIESHSDCRSMTRLAKPGLDRHETWNDRWRPRSADEVLGNETQARYLRDWLLALQVQSHSSKAAEPDASELGNAARETIDGDGKMTRGVKRLKVIRTVDKTRRKKRRLDSDDESLDDWIAEDDEEEDSRPPKLPAGGSDEEWPDVNEGASPWKPKLTRLNRRRLSNDESLNPEGPPPEIQTQSPVHDFSQYLTNTILLVGPSGVGKTAAVFACAKELGWEVFEVYPGIGKRNGSSLLSLVGDVSKNHIVGMSASGSARSKVDEGKGKNPERSGFASLFSRAENKGHSLGNPPQPIEPGKSGNLDERASLRARSPSVPLQDFGFFSSNNHPLNSNEDEPPQRGARQSIILLEEVDILFGEDVNFWPTVVTLIRESRRPVIMTCNDPSLVPFGDLPLQTTLVFNPSSPDFAATYLQCLALTEGYAPTKDQMKALYEASPAPSAVDNPDNLMRSSAHQVPPPDLRHAINNLQFLCHHPETVEDAVIEKDMMPGSLWPNQSTRTGEILPDDLYGWGRSSPLPSIVQLGEIEHGNSDQTNLRSIYRLRRFSETMSLVDSYLRPSPSGILETLCSEGGSTSDVQYGYHHLVHESTAPHLQGGIAFYNHDEPIALETVLSARKAMGKEISGHELGPTITTRTDKRRMLSSSELLRQRSTHFTCISGLLDGIVPFGAKQSMEAVILDYEPWVRAIDHADGLLEIAAAKDSEARAALRGGRTTRNSQRQAYVRYFRMSDEHRVILRDTALRMDDTLQE